MRHSARRGLVLVGAALALVFLPACAALNETTLRPPVFKATASVPVPLSAVTGVPSAATAAAKYYSRRAGYPLAGNAFVSEVNLAALPHDQLSLVQDTSRSAGYTLGAADITRLRMFTFPVRVPRGTIGGIRFVSVLMRGSKVVGVFGSQPDMAPDVFGLGDPS